MSSGGIQNRKEKSQVAMWNHGETVQSLSRIEPFVDTTEQATWNNYSGQETKRNSSEMKASSTPAQNCLLCSSFAMRSLKAATSNSCPSLEPGHATTTEFEHALHKEMLKTFLRHICEMEVNYLRPWKLVPGLESESLLAPYADQCWDHRATRQESSSFKQAEQRRVLCRHQTLGSSQNEIAVSADATASLSRAACHQGAVSSNS